MKFRGITGVTTDTGVSLDTMGKSVIGESHSGETASKPVYNHGGKCVDRSCRHRPRNSALSTGLISPNVVCQKTFYRATGTTVCTVSYTHVLVLYRRLVLRARGLCTYSYRSRTLVGYRRVCYFSLVVVNEKRNVAVPKALPSASGAVTRGYRSRKPVRHI